MKKQLLFVLVLSMFMCAQAGVVKKTYYFKNPVVEQNRGFATLNFDGARLTGLAGEPMLPYQEVRLLLESGQVVDYIELVRGEEIHLTGNYELLPAQYSKPLSNAQVSEFLKKEEVYQSKDDYPLNSLGKFTTEFYNGHSIALGSFTPVVYLPSEKKLSFYSEITLIIHTRSDASAQNAQMFVKNNSAVQQKLEKLIQNSEMIKYKAHTLDYTSGYEILLITDALFTDKFDELVMAYKQRGYRTEIVSTSDIYNSTSGVDNPEKIRNYIIEEYQNNDIEHVILGGDVEYIPYRGFYCQVQSSSVYEDDNIPSDLYYSALDGTWNDDGDNLWGEIDEDDLLPELSVGRMSFSNEEELQNMITKSLRYQNEPVEGELTQPLFAGEHLWSDPLTYGSDYLELHIGLHDDNNYTTQGMPEDYSFRKLYAKDQDWSSSDLMAEVNLGRPFLYHCGHANFNTVMNLFSWDVTDANFYNANGVDHSYTVIYTHGCICGSFDNDDCIAEEMVKIKNFAAAFVGNSRYGWFNEGQTEGPSQHIHREFSDAVFKSKVYNIGAAHMESKAETSSWVNAPGQWEEGAQRWCFYDCNVLGDPVMALYTREPIAVQAQFTNEISLNDTEFTATISCVDGDVEGLRCAVMVGNDLVGYGIVSDNGSVTIPFFESLSEVNGAKLIVSGRNCKPTVFQVNDNVGINKYDDQVFKCYPNPVNDVLFIESFEKGQFNVIIESLNGSQIINRKVDGTNGAKIQIDIQDIKSGVYFVTVHSAKGSSSQKLVVK